MNWKFSAVIIAAVFLLVAAYLFDPDQAMKMLDALVSAFGGV